MCGFNMEVRLLNNYIYINIIYIYIYINYTKQCCLNINWGEICWNAVIYFAPHALPSHWPPMLRSDCLLFRYHSLINRSSSRRRFRLKDSARAFSDAALLRCRKASRCFLVKSRASFFRICPHLRRSFFNAITFLFTFSWARLSVVIFPRRLFGWCFNMSCIAIRILSRPSILASPVFKCLGRCRFLSSFAISSRSKRCRLLWRFRSPGHGFINFWSCMAICWSSQICRCLAWKPWSEW